MAGIVCRLDRQRPAALRRADPALDESRSAIDRAEHGLPARDRFRVSRHGVLLRIALLQRWHGAYPPEHGHRLVRPAAEHPAELCVDLRPFRRTGPGRRRLRLGQRHRDVVHGVEHGRLDLLGPLLCPHPGTGALRPPAMGRDQAPGRHWPADWHRRVRRVQHLRGHRAVDRQSRLDRGGRASDRPQYQLVAVHDSLFAGHGGDRAGRPGTGGRQSLAGALRGEGRARRGTGVRGVLGEPDPAPARTYRLDLHA
ncbi:hypothetical protein D9M71_431020 [compost metagenome]